MRTKILLTFLILTLTSAVLPKQALAQSEFSSPNLVLLIIDNSGSMKDNDPDGLRFTAARMFLSLLDEGTAAGSIIFSTTSQPQTPAIVDLGNLQERRQLIDAIQPTPADGYTDIRAAFQDAGKILADYQRPRQKEARPVIILLTDGQPEIEKPYAAYKSDTLALIESLQVPVLSIALTRSADTAFLNQVAVQTAGSVIPAENAADLLKAYLQVFGQIKDRTIVELGAAQSQFDLDPALAPVVEQVSFVLTWKGKRTGTVGLVGPDGQETNLTNTSASYQALEDPYFAVITLRQPAAGSWRLRVDGQAPFAAYAILHTRLRIHLDLPEPLLEAGQALTIRLVLLEEEQDGSATPLIGEANFSAIVTQPDGSQERLDRFYDDGSHGDLQANDGEYSRAYVNTIAEGLYQVDVQGWKGLTPISAAGQIQTVRFPELILEEPQDQLYTIRNQPVQLKAHLDGVQEGQLEQGELIASLTAPSGEEFEVPLEPASQGYQAAFMPQESGDYQVEISTHGATFLGMPFTRTLKAQFQTHIIPMLTLQNEMVDLGRVELDAMSQGIPFTIRAVSTSPVVETIQVRLDGLPNLSLQAQDSLQVFPGIANELSLRLLPQTSLTPGAYRGSVVFAARQDLDLVPHSVPLAFEIYQPVVEAGLPVPTNNVSTCPGWQSTLVFPVQAGIAAPETIHLRLESQDASLTQTLVLSPTELTLQTGNQQVSVHLQGLGSVPSGRHTVHLVMEGRQGLQIQPAYGTPLVLDVSPLFLRCKKPIGVGLGIWLAVAAGGLWIGNRIRTRNKPPFVTGTLRHWPITDPGQAIEVDLTGLQKPEVLIGESEPADVIFPEPTLAPLHALIKVERSQEDEYLVVEPLAPLRKGYRKVEAVFRLNHEDTFQIGQWQIQYLSDHPLD